ncbi:MAG: cell division protein FtsA [Syntrophomonadaceae bacterium]|nr:cell division protein FtsA [Syntrophomonadaceae bacterium]
MKIRKRNMVVSLDIGTSTVKAAMAEVSYNRELHVLGLAEVPSYGLRKGNIIDIESTAKSIDDCLNELERITGIEVQKAVLGFSGTSISTIDNHAVVSVGNTNYEITQEDRERVIQSARNIALPSDKAIIQTIEKQYIVDGYDGVKDPVGMVGNRLEVEVIAVIAAIAAIQNLQRSTEKVNLPIEQFVFNPLLAGESTLLPTEKEMGVVLIDIGGGTTEISFFENGSLVNSSVLPIGGEYITKDLALVLKTSIDEAARIKEKNGTAKRDFCREDVVITIRNIQGREVKQVSQYMIADIINARVVEIIEMIHNELSQFNCLDRIPGGLVLTGGEARLVGMAETFEETINIPTRIGSPENLRGIQAELNQPQNSVVIGGLMYASDQPGVFQESNPKISGFYYKVNDWFKELFR